jgi:acyl-CoA synthetase (NDP forming)
MRADSLEDLGALATALAHQPLPAGRRVAIVTNAGGPAILCADACEAGKLSVPELSETVQQRLRAAVPRAASVKNPVDLIASATPVDYRRTVSILLDSDEVDAIIVIYVSLDDAGIAMMTAGIADGVADGRGGVAPQRPVLACVIAGVATAGPLVTPTERIPVYGFPELPARVLGQTAAYAAWRRSPPGIAVTPSNMDLDVARSICRRAAERGTGWLSAADTHGVLHAVGLSLPAGGFAASPEEAVTLAERVGFPVAVKLASRRIVHKSEVDAVKLGLRDAEAVRRSFEAIRERVVKDGESDAMDGVVVQPMLGGAIEVMAGITQDDLFGPLVAFGLGGVHVEVLGDVQFRVAPLTDRDAADMVRGIRGARLLEGYRGKPAADIAAIEDLLLRLSRLAETVEEIRELDLNPVFAQRPGDGCIVADARIRVARHDAK